ncbi:membrane protein [Mycobacterium tuberculosis]|nr:membrane protein [Mycobacterium tuberculosis]
MPQQTLAAGVFVGALLCGVVTAAVPPHARADVVAYLVNVTVRPGYNFANADAALSYGHGLCEKVSRAALTHRSSPTSRLISTPATNTRPRICSARLSTNSAPR